MNDVTKSYYMSVHLDQKNETMLVNIVEIASIIHGQWKARDLLYSGLKRPAYYLTLNGSSSLTKKKGPLGGIFVILLEVRPNHQEYPFSCLWCARLLC